MADSKQLKEILFRHAAEQCKVCEAIPFEAVGHRFGPMSRFSTS